MKYSLIFIVLSTLLYAATSLSSAFSATIDFEDLTDPEGTEITSLSGVSFTNLFLNIPGGPPNGFQAPAGNDNATTGNSLSLNSFRDTGSIMFTSPVINVSLNVLDLELDRGNNERVLFEAFDSANSKLGSVLANEDGSARNGSIIFVDFSGVSSISRIDFTRITGSNDLSISGYAIDDISFTPVPIPPAILLFGSALAGLIGIRRKI